MPHLIIGHTTATTTRIWVRGDRTSTTCEVTLRGAGADTSQTLTLVSEHDYTGTTDFTGLTTGGEYCVLAKFSPSGDAIHGRVRLMTEVSTDGLEPFSFVLSSCNLSVVSINNFLARLAATAGTSLAYSSLDLPVERWKAPSYVWLRTLLRRPLGWGLGLIGKAVLKTTQVKQPGPPYIRSPFLKLSAVFDAWRVEVHYSSSTGGAPFVAVGDSVRSSSGAVGVVASNQVEQKPGAQPTAATEAPPTDKPPTLFVRRLVLTHVEGRFKNGDSLVRLVTSDSGRRELELGTIERVVSALPWFSRPSFFLHAGDQIYYDFPTPDRAPSPAEYRDAYREAWFEDESLRHLLAHWPHYMTLDDHEIADQFALDFKVPIKELVKNKKVEPVDYLSAARVAYDEYAHALAPAPVGGGSTRKDGPYGYTFDKGQAHFFVLDTRTSRWNEGTPAIIDEEQMLRLLNWLTQHRHDLKFVVTSVPFVAQINEPASNRKEDWFKDEKRNSEQDKWSAERFQHQRNRIIRHIAATGIERLVFLTGDMHCCYHATMRIGPAASKYESITIHELAGGPVNQLQLANVNEFDRRCAKTTGGKEPVDYEVVLERFHSDVSAVMHVKVEYTHRDEVTSPGRSVVPEVEWNVIRTLTDPGPAGWSDGDALPDAATSTGESVMAGRITFVRRRTTKGLRKW